MKKPEARWSALKGLIFKKRDRSGNIQTAERPVQVQEYAKSVVVPPDKDTAHPYGIPIEATLAINLISDFHLLLGEFKDVFIKGGTLETKLKTEKMDSFYKSINTLVQILRRSCAITIDKNVLLKTLSQPGCEGLRFYLCKKSNEGKDYVSLVTVGVDSNGKDHLYDYTPQSKQKTVSVETTSLTSEYGFPPGGGSKKSFESLSLREIYGEPYPLLNYALDISMR
ncbi:MAG: hypothetical protein JST43_04900 [Bacteroidetes bacterium]|nr:hypothetical protein [Bacteroidota bacterium]MBS1539837.1 hypothetical protein [Bacteroidota bacterium]